MSGRRPKPHPYAQELEWATIICARHGCVVERSDKMFEVATVKGYGVQLVIYPHRTNSGHYHLRVRNNGSKDKAKATTVLRAMDLGEGLPEDDRKKVQFTRTFSVKNVPHMEGPR